MRLVAVLLPDLGTGPDATILVSQWHAAVGATVWQGDRLVELLVGPAAFDLPAPADGLLTEIRAREDDRVVPGDVLGMLAVPDDQADDAP
jgi:pyruvate/2-oxoglutarate dehydrogenase complex dihydrolipoamide acyltransferase (E2) component